MALLIPIESEAWPSTWCLTNTFPNFFQWNPRNVAITNYATSHKGPPPTPWITFLQFIHASNFPGSINGVNVTHSLRQVDVVRQRSSEVSQQGIKAAKTVRGHSVHNPLEVTVPIAVETYLLGFLLIAQCLQGSGSVEATMRTVSGARQPVHPWTSHVPGCLISFIKMSKIKFHILVEPQRPECWRKGSRWKEAKKKKEAGEKKKSNISEIQICNLLLVKRTGWKKPITHLLLAPELQEYWS